MSGARRLRAATQSSRLRLEFVVYAGTLGEKMRRFAFVIAALLLAMLARAEAADAPAPKVFSTISRTDMIALMQQAGLTTVVDSTTDEATPWVQGRTSTDDPVVVYFFQCEANVTGPQRQCAHLNLNVFWNNTKGTDAAAVNSYNTQRVFGRGSLSADAKLITFDYAVDIEGGVTGDYIIKNIAYFLLALGEFKTITNP
jgi:hypothetical protein